jgi:hypothetical protein
VIQNVLIGLGLAANEKVSTAQIPEATNAAPGFDRPGSGL